MSRPPMRPSRTRPDEQADRDPTRDPELAAALRRRDAGVSDTDTLRRAIAASARERLARLEHGEGTDEQWWDWTARWARAAIPIACAAGLIGVAVTAMLALPAVEEQQVLRAPVVAFATVASPDANSAQLIDSLVGPATHDWVLNGAVSR